MGDATRAGHDRVPARCASEIGDELAGPLDRALLAALLELTTGPVLDVGGARQRALLPARPATRLRTALKSGRAAADETGLRAPRSRPPSESLMIARTPALCALTIGLSVLTLSAPASAASPGPATFAEQAQAAAAAPVTAASGPLAAVSVRSDVSTAYAGRYAKFLSSFRCEKGRYYHLFGAVEQSRRGEVVAMASSEDQGPTGVCTGRSQRRMVYVVTGPVDDEGTGPAPALRSGRGDALVALATSRTRRSERPRFDAIAFATVRVAPR